MSSLITILAERVLARRRVRRVRALRAGERLRLVRLPGERLGKRDVCRSMVRVISVFIVSSLSV